MERYIYKNHQVVIDGTETGHDLSISFGDMTIREELEEKDIKIVKRLARQLINELVAELPPALSYKHFKDGDY